MNKWCLHFRIQIRSQTLTNSPRPVPWPPHVHPRACSSWPYYPKNKLRPFWVRAEETHGGVASLNHMNIHWVNILVRVSFPISIVSNPCNPSIVWTTGDWSLFIVGVLPSIYIWCALAESSSDMEHISLHPSCDQRNICGGCREQRMTWDEDTIFTYTLTTLQGCGTYVALFKYKSTKKTL